MPEENKKSLRERFVAARDEKRAAFKAAELNKASIRLHEYVDTLESRVEQAVDMIRHTALEEKDVMREIGDNLRFTIDGINIIPAHISHADLLELSGYRRLHSFCKDADRDIACKVHLERKGETTTSQLKIDISVDMPYTQSSFSTLTQANSINLASVPDYEPPAQEFTLEDATAIINRSVANERARRI